MALDVLKDRVVSEIAMIHGTLNGLNERRDHRAPDPNKSTMPGSPSQFLLKFFGEFRRFEFSESLKKSVVLRT